MRFLCKEVYDRFIECRNFAASHGLTDNFNSAFVRFLSWESYDEWGNCTNEVIIGNDFDKKSFTFHEHRSDGRTGICGGIIFHGLPGHYQENGSVMLEPSYGWQIHT